MRDGACWAQGHGVRCGAVGALDRGARAGLASILSSGGAASAASASVVHNGSSARKQIALTFDDNTTAPTGRWPCFGRCRRTRCRPRSSSIGSAVNAYPSINTEIVKGMAAGSVRSGRPHLVAPGADRALDVGHGRADRRRHRRLPQGHGCPDGAPLPASLRLHQLPGSRGGGQRGLQLPGAVGRRPARLGRRLGLGHRRPRQSAMPTTAPSWSCTSRRRTPPRPSRASSRGCGPRATSS